MNKRRVFSKLRLRLSDSVYYDTLSILHKRNNILITYLCSFVTFNTTKGKQQKKIQRLLLHNHMGESNVDQITKQSDEERLPAFILEKCLTDNIQDEQIEYKFNAPLCISQIYENELFPYVCLTFIFLVFYL